MFFQCVVDHTPTFQPAIILADDGMEISHLLKQNFQWMTSWYFQDNKLVLHAIFYTSWNDLLSDDKIIVMPVSCYDNWVSNLFCLNCLLSLLAILRRRIWGRQNRWGVRRPDGWGTCELEDGEKTDTSNRRNDAEPEFKDDKFVVRR